MKNMTIQLQSIEIFVGKLVEEKGFSEIDSEVVVQIKKDLLDRVEDCINAAILEHMPKNKMKEFDALLDSANEKEIQAFCSDNIENLNEIIAEALMRFRETYLNT